MELNGFNNWAIDDTFACNQPEEYFRNILTDVDTSNKTRSTPFIEVPVPVNPTPIQPLQPMPAPLVAKPEHGMFMPTFKPVNPANLNINPFTPPAKVYSSSDFNGRRLSSQQIPPVTLPSENIRLNKNGLVRRNTYTRIQVSLPPLNFISHVSYCWQMPTVVAPNTVYLSLVVDSPDGFRTSLQQNEIFSEVTCSLQHGEDELVIAARFKFLKRPRKIFEGWKNQCDMRCIVKTLFKDANGSTTFCQGSKLFRFDSNNSQRANNEYRDNKVPTLYSNTETSDNCIREHVLPPP